MQKVPHLEEYSSNYPKLFRVVYKGSLADAANVKCPIINGLGEMETKYEPNFHFVL